jgi:ribosome-associated protein
MIRLTEVISVADRELEERFVRASGPGGQNVNKVATAVELRFDVRASSLPAAVKDRLMVLAGRRVTTDGVLVVVSRVHRSQGQNRAAARARLAALLKRAAKAPRRRRPTKPRRAAREERREAKKVQGAIKRSRSRVQVED